jgi:hypothetical protein
VRRKGMVEEQEEEKEDKGGHCRVEGQPPPRSPHVVASVTP